MDEAGQHALGVARRERFYSVWGEVYFDPVPEQRKGRQTSCRGRWMGEYVQVVENNPESLNTDLSYMYLSAVGSHELIYCWTLRPAFSSAVTTEEFAGAKPAILNLPSNLNVPLKVTKKIYQPRCLLPQLCAAPLFVDSIGLRSGRLSSEILSRGPPESGEYNIAIT